MKELIALSHYAGGRIDLIQAGGGNASIKNSDATMAIKASGSHLFDVTETDNWVTVQYDVLRAYLEKPFEGEKKEREKRAEGLLKKATLSEGRPSIETWLHALLKRCTLHTHPIAVNKYLCRREGVKHLKSLFPHALFVPYETPGIDLAVALEQRLSIPTPSIIFLENHGLIVTADTVEQVVAINESIILEIDEELAHLRAATPLSHLVEQVTGATCFIYPALRPYFLLPPFCPDTFVFCGARPVEVESLSNPQPFLDYREEWGEWPKMLLYKEHLYFIAPNYKRAKEMEDVFFFHSMASQGEGEISFLEEEELRYLSSWEAEKFRLLSQDS